MRSFIENVDFFKGNDPEEIAGKYGTPLYVYNEDIIRDRMLRVAGVIKKYPYRANYSCKTNTNLEILRIANSVGVNADAMSEGEMRMLLAAGFSPVERFVYLAVFATPVAASSFPMAQSMGGDGELAGQLVFVSTMVSLLTIFGFVFGMSQMGLIA